MKRSVQVMLVILYGIALTLNRTPSARAQAAPLRVAAAADLTKAFTEMADAYRKKTGQPVTLIFGATGMLTKQIENDAPFDFFAAANESYLVELEKKALIVPGTRRLYAQGRIVLWTRKDGPPCPKSVSELDAPRYKKIAIANPQHAPYGGAAREALQSAGLWDRLQPRLVFGENIQQTLQFVQSGNVDAAIVSLSLAKDGAGNYTLIPLSAHKPLRQAMAVLKSSRQIDAAKRFSDFVNGSEGRRIMQKYGFLLPGAKRKE